jgi:hypothetical protein
MPKYPACGDTDVYAIADLPDHAAAAALALTRRGRRNRPNHGAPHARGDRRRQRAGGVVQAAW